MKMLPWRCKTNIRLYRGPHTTLLQPMLIKILFRFSFFPFHRAFQPKSQQFFFHLSCSAMPSQNQFASHPDLITILSITVFEWLLVLQFAPFTFRVKLNSLLLFFTSLRNWTGSNKVSQVLWAVLKGFKCQEPKFKDLCSGISSVPHQAYQRYQYRFLGGCALNKTGLSHDEFCQLSSICHSFLYN